jgi:hypothetical protein
MPLPIDPSLAISAIQALLRYRDQVDTILSLNEATAGLPFALPPAPTEDAPHLQDMLKFFNEDRGKMILQLQNMEGDFNLVAPNPTAITPPAIIGARNRLFKLYYDAAGVQPNILGPADPPTSVKKIQGLSTPDQRLAYYIVDSQRLSHNTALARVLLATSDTLLEFVGANASLFFANKQTQAMVTSLIDEFTQGGDFDDQGAEVIFKRLLGVSIVAFANNPPGDLGAQPALKALFAALADVRKNLGNDGDDFVAGLISVKGFEELIAAYAGEVAKDPSFITNNDLAQHVLTATLTQISKDFPKLTSDPDRAKALLGVLEAGIGAAAADLAPLLQKDLGDHTLLAAVFAAVLNKVSTLASGNQLFTGQVLPDLYKVTLQAVAASPDLVGDQNKIAQFASDLIAGLANALSEVPPSNLFTTETLKALASESLTVLAADPEFLAGNNQFATKLLAAVFKAGATAIGDGLTKDDLIDIATAAIKASADNIGLLKLDDKLAAVITAAGDALAAAGLKQLLNTQGRKALLFKVLQAIAANPTVWGDLQGANLVQPLVQAILQGLANDPKHLLSGPVLVDAISRILQAAVRRGQQLIDQKVTSDQIKKLLTAALDRATQEVGKTVDGENLPAFLERVVAAFLDKPFAITDPPSADFQQLLDGVLAGLDH